MWFSFLYMHRISLQVISDIASWLSLNSADLGTVWMVSWQRSLFSIVGQAPDEAPGFPVSTSPSQAPSSPLPEFSLTVGDQSLQAAPADNTASVSEQQQQVDDVAFAARFCEWDPSHCLSFNYFIPVYLCVAAKFAWGSVPGGGEKIGYLYCMDHGMRTSWQSTVLTRPHMAHILLPERGDQSVPTPARLADSRRSSR